MKRIFSISLFTLFLISCQNNKKEVVNDTCSTANVTYSVTITNIINSNGCLSCHGGSSPIAGFNLDSYATVKAKASETRSGTSVLYGALAHMSAFTPMPQGLPQLSSCNLAKVKAWIDTGMPQ